MEGADGTGAFEGALAGAGDVDTALVTALGTRALGKGATDGRTLSGSTAERSDGRAPG